MREDRSVYKSMTTTQHDWIHSSALYHVVIRILRYTLLVGRPPFETMSLKETYTRIKTNQYVIPSRISRSAAKLIQKFLSNNPQSRPCLHTVCETDEFFVKGFVPSSLPSSCCMVPPRFTALHRSSSTSEQKGTIKPTSDKINYVLTKLQLNDENTNDMSKWIDKETKSSCSSSPTQGKVVGYLDYIVVVYTWLKNLYKIFPRWYRKRLLLTPRLRAFQSKRPSSADIFQIICISLNRQIVATQFTTLDNSQA